MISKFSCDLVVIIPLNMAESVPTAPGSNAAHGLDFSPHGAGNFSRTEDLRQLAADTELVHMNLTPTTLPIFLER